MKQIINEEPGFLSSLPIVNFLLSLMIVIHHGFTRSVSYIDSYSVADYGMLTAIERYLYNLSECAVPIFYFLSAYLFYRTYDGTKEKYYEKMKRRFWSLLVPYLIFNTIGYAKAIVFSGRNGGGNDYLLSIWSSDTMPLWFIRELIFFSVLAPVVCWMKRNFWISFIVSLVLVALSAMNIVGYRSFLYWLPIYLMGASLTKEKITKVSLCYSDLKNRWCMILLLCLYFVWAWFLPNGAEKENAFYGLEYSLFRIATPIIFSIVFYMILRLKIKPRRWMNYSFFVYCLHAPMLTLVGIVYTRIIPEFIGGELLRYVTVVGLTYAFCVWCAMFLERFLPPVWGVLNGKRAARN